MTAVKLPVVVLISGSGSNLQAIIDAANNELPVEICAVISNKANAYGLERANKAGIKTVVIDHTQFDGREAFDAELRRTIDAYDPGLIVLAGFMRILSDGFVHHYEGRMLNIHPSLLPRYKGTNTHARAIEAGDREAGCSVHLVTAELDSGQVLLQARVPVLEGDTPEKLAARVLEQEHKIYPEAIKLMTKKLMS